jgi:glycosyltransferase involved in cell wall biosynthesis
MKVSKGSGDRLGVVSHVLPPSPSGQAVALHRLLGEMPRDRYVLISRESYDDSSCAASALKLPAKYFHLEPFRRLQAFGKLHMEVLDELWNAFPGIIGRARQIARIAREERCCLLIGCSGDLYDLPATRLAGRWVGIPVIPYFFDDYVYQWTGARRAIAHYLESCFLRGVRDAIVPNESLEEEYWRRRGVRATVIRNPCPVPDLAELDRVPRCFDPGTENIVYSGAVYRAHYDAFRNLVAAIRLADREDVRLHVFTAQSREELAGNGIAGPFVVHHPHVDVALVPAILRQADILFLPLAFRSPIPEVVRTSCPGKTGEYLSAARPILVHAPGDSFVSNYFRKYGCGMVVDRDDPGALSDAIKTLLPESEATREMAARAREMAKRDFSIETEGARFRGLIGLPGLR